MIIVSRGVASRRKQFCEQVTFGFTSYANHTYSCIHSRAIRACDSDRHIVRDEELRIVNSKLSLARRVILYTRIIIRRTFGAASVNYAVRLLP